MSEPHRFDAQLADAPAAILRYHAPAFDRPPRRIQGAPVIKALIGYLLAIPLMGAALVLALECTDASRPAGVAREHKS